MIDVPVSSRSVRIRSRIWAWIVTSRAVVGSSAMSRSGSQASAMAIITRWAMPPDSSCGNDLSRRSGSGMPTIRSSSRARSWAASPVILRCSSRTSLICQSTSRTGFSDEVGCWKIMRDPVAPDLAHLVAREAHQVRAVEQDLAGVDRARRGDQAQDRQAGHALAAAGFADETHDLAAADREVDAVDGLDHAFAGLERGSQALDLEERPAISRPGRPACRRRHELLDGGLVERRSEDLDRGFASVID